MRVADQVFAPHYAAPMAHAVVADAPLLATRGGEAIGTVDAGQTFEALEITADHAWGVAADGTVGFVALSALERP